MATGNKFPVISPFDTRSKFLHEGATPNSSGISRPQTQWLQAVGVALNNSAQARPAPATLTSPGQPNQFGFDDNFFYFCVAPNTWKRIAWTP